ncbi:MAG: hypothetical protein ACPG5P_08115 [Saprospiraceae bacterium]
MKNNILELKPFLKMGALKLKEEIVESLDNLSEKYLKAVHALIRSLEEESDWWDELSEDEKLSVGKGLEQSEKGEVVPHDEVMGELRAKYKRA